MHVGWSVREVLIDVAFPVRYSGDAVRRRQNFTGARRRVEPAPRLLVGCRAPAPWPDLTLVPVPDLGIDEAKQRARSNLKRQSRMQQQSAQRSALADRSITARPRPPTSQRQFARVLGHHDVATRNPPCCAGGGVAHHLVGGHRMIAQQPREPHLLRPSSGKSPDTRARPLNQGRMKGGPPFSRRRSPNRPSPNSIVTAASAN